MAMSIITAHTVRVFYDLKFITFSPDVPIHQNPAFLIATSFLIIGVFLVYIPPKRLPRIVATGIVVAHICRIFLFMHNIPPASGLYYICFAVALALYANYFLCITLTTPPTNKLGLQKAFWVIATITNLRGAGTAQKLRDLPPFSRQDPAYIPSRSSFLVSRILKIFGYFALLVALSVVEREFYYPSLKDGDYNEEKEQFFRRLHDIELRELAIRLYLPILSLGNQYAALSLYHTLLSIVAVAAGDEPARWPSLFGDIRDAYSLRRFFGIFWQRILRTAFVSHAALITQSVLGIPRRTRLARIIITILVFMISALMHAMQLKLLGGACLTSPVIRWYFLIAVGIVLEDLALSTCKSFGFENKKSQHSLTCWSWVGYVWVWSWFSWSLPKIVYPNFLCWEVEI